MLQDSSRRYVIIHLFWVDQYFVSIADRIPLSALQKWEVALKKIFPSTNLEPTISEPSVSGSSSTVMHPPSGQPPSMTSSQAPTAPVATRAPQLELQSTNSPTLSYTTPTMRYAIHFTV